MVGYVLGLPIIQALKSKLIAHQMTPHQLVKKIFGWRNWAVFNYNAFLENIFVVFYIALTLQDFSTSFLLGILYFYLFSIFSTSYGYLINDLSDRELDLQHGKPNTFHDVSVGSASVIVVIVFVASAVFTIPFITAPGFVILWAGWWFTTTFYSLKPIRLKERGFLGLAVVVVAQRLLPTLLIFSAFQFHFLLDIILISLYVLMRGLASDLNHQIEDFRLDANTATSTFAVTKGISRTEKIFKVVLELDRFLLAMVLFRMGLMLNEVYLTSLHPVWLLLAGFIPVYAIALIRIIRDQFANPFDVRQKSIFQFVHHAFPSVIMPVYLCLLMIPHNFFYGVAILLFAWNKGLFRKITWQQSFPVALVRKLLAGEGK